MKVVPEIQYTISANGVEKARGYGLPSIDHLFWLWDPFYDTSFKNADDYKSNKFRSIQNSLK